MSKIKQSGQTMILKCDGCFNVTILIFKHFDFGFEKILPDLKCHICGLKKYIRKDKTSLSLTGQAHPIIKCEKCKSEDIVMLGNDINLCLSCFSFFKKS